MIDRALDFLLPFFAVTTLILALIVGGSALWSMLPLLIAWIWSSPLIALFWVSAACFALCIAIAIGRN